MTAGEGTGGGATDARGRAGRATGGGQTSARVARRLPIGAELVGDGVHVRVWAPKVKTLDAVIVSSVDRPERAVRSVHPLARAGDGYLEGVIPGASAGDLYMLRLDGDRLRADPASRFQPAGPHGPSQVVDPSAYRWRTERWPAPGERPDVVYEMHVGTFSREGTYRGALTHLPRLADLGITILEIMPLSDFVGRFGWGYDGVLPFAPYQGYGAPDDFRVFVDEAHRLGLNVVMDVVYNHFGPDGCYLRDFSDSYFTSKYEGEWGDPINFDGEGNEGPRELVISNARYWIDEYRLDGLRLDATQAVFDDSPVHVVRELIEAARAATSRPIWIVAENEPQESRLVRRSSVGGFNGDALWNDDFHHSAVVAAIGRRDAYYHDYTGTAQEFVSAAKYGYLYQGQYYAWQKKARGSAALDLPVGAFVCFLENHDQVSNSLTGERLRQLASPGRFRALTALLLLGPWVPMLFQGEEWGSERPFLYFADMPEALREPVTSGRKDFIAQFRGAAENKDRIADPCAVETFERCRLERPDGDTDTLRLHRDLIRMRNDDAAFRSPARVDGAVLGARAFVLRFAGASVADDRLLVVNLGTTLRRASVAEPLLAPPDGRQWARVWDSERADYGGQGLGELDLRKGVRICGECAVVLGATSPPTP